MLITCNSIIEILGVIELKIIFELRSIMYADGIFFAHQNPDPGHHKSFDNQPII